MIRFTTYTELENKVNVNDHIEITVLKEVQRPEWESLARDYKTFYETELNDKCFEVAWSRLTSGDRVFGIGATFNNQLVGIAHYLFHTTTWDPCV